MSTLSTTLQTHCNNNITRVNFSLNLLVNMLNVISSNTKDLKAHSHFHLVQIFKYLKISLEVSSWTHVLIKSVLFNLHTFGDFPATSPLSISSLIPLWSGCRYCTISILLDLCRYVSWPRMGVSW